MNSKTYNVDYLARVEGEGALHVQVKGSQVTDVKLKIFEPPRFFEALLRGRAYSEAPDITARICGICPIAYQMSAVHAMEDALGIKVEGQLRLLRRLLYCGEWISSHALHIFFLHAPDFLGYPDSIQMAKDYPEVVRRGLQLKKAGNAIIACIGGREVHPINVRVGGFYKLPSRRDLAPLAEQVKWARQAALETVRWTAQFPYPDFEQAYEFVALCPAHEYPLDEGRLTTTRGVSLNAREFEQHFIEEQVPYSHALHAVHKGIGPYCVGPLARYTLNFDQFPELIQEEARGAGLGPICRNPFRSIIVRSLEVLYACHEALRLIEQYEPPDRAAIEVVPRASEGWSITEAPRGILYHHYQLDEEGLILKAKIIPPTSQNQKMIEEDLRRYIPQVLNAPGDQLLQRCEQMVRNYDPCISCATHFLKLTIER
ncbi:Ni/Fe hydrogenase subunit alpha [Ktedonobacter sp. SOSP1-85]|uniref:Ni/Fe hydrogenase subunit alpha n=1 Tax=Ktedonobacter sp. SOSP1-85 TaxID=2778367 RepID=UPI0019156293|nr:Ni/Fe hydrogenase subunit alpha [Ktedonobacter sp. SOSP1-85]GHO80194.1 Ni/Fe hydrogenase subunit alpha [Ktedonobacter sp. SOSP1-85]